MEYQSVREVAEKWGISERYVQRYCTQGRIEGAMKFGGVWVIPIDAIKPADKRKRASSQIGEDDCTECGDLIAMPLLNTQFVPGRCMESIVKISDEHSRNIALAELYYFSGRPTEASDLAERYLTSEIIPLRLSACWIYTYANLAIDRAHRSRQAMLQVKSTLASLEDDAPASLRALSIFVTAAEAILLHLPLPEGLPSMKPYIQFLPTGLRLFALYLQAHYSYLNGNYAISVGIVETALGLFGESYPIPSIYLHLVATMDYINLKQPIEAREHLLAAWALAKPDDLIQPFGEHHGLLGGMLEAIIKKEHPEDFRRIISVTYNFASGWRKIHNPETGHHVADDLTTTEFTIAMLATRGWSNKEIGAHLDISPNTVKLHISTVLQKLHISQRKDLAKFMLK